MLDRVDGKQVTGIHLLFRFGLREEFTLARKYLAGLLQVVFLADQLLSQ
jgi:hypothetical protein